MAGVNPNALDVTQRSRFALMSPLRRDEIVARLRQNVDSNWTTFGSKPIVGRVGRDSFRLSVRIWYRSSFQTSLRGRLFDEGSSTRIQCRAGMHPFVIAFMTLWFSILSLMSLAIIGSQWRSGEHLIWRLAPGALMVAFAVGMIAVGRWFARDELRALIAFLEETIDASPARS